VIVSPSNPVNEKPQISRYFPRLLQYSDRDLFPELLRLPVIRPVVEPDLGDEREEVQRPESAKSDLRRRSAVQNAGPLRSAIRSLP